jgi:hypothetical protein
MREKYVLAVNLLLLATILTSPSFAQDPMDGGSAITAVAQLPAKTVQKRLDSLLYDWKAFNLDLVGIDRAVRRAGRVQLNLGGRFFDLEVQPNDVRGPEYVQVYQTARGQIRVEPSPVATFKGTVVGEPDSVVRLLVLPDLLQGYIRVGQEWLFIDPLLKYAKGQPTSYIVVFDERDVRPEAIGLCGSGELHRVAADLPTGKSTLAKSGTTHRRLDLATEADHEYSSIYGVNANQQIQGVINQVDGIYRPELSGILRIVFQSVWTTSSDPYTASDSEVLLNQFRNYWNANRGDVGRDAAHLFTGRDMDGNTIGIAWVGIICNNPSHAYGVSQNSGLMAKLVAHEIGHNLAANHDDEVSPPASTCNGSGTIMCSFIQANGPNSFSQRSKNDISSHITSHGSCLENVLLPSSTTTPAFFENFLGWGDLGQCGYGAGGVFYGSQGAEAGTWTQPVRMDMDNRSGGCTQEFGLYDPFGQLAGLQLKVNFGGTANQCWNQGIRTVPISSSFSSSWSNWSSVYALDTDDKAGYCTQTFSIEGRSDVALDVAFEAEANNGQCGNVGTFPVVLGRPASFTIDTDGRAGGCRQKFRLRLNADADNDGVGDRFDSCPYVYGSGANGCPTVCGNWSCESGEDGSNCPFDCGFCGDFVCGAGENDFNCPNDCGGGGGGESCGDGFCDVFQGECAANCPQDCTGGEFCQ